MIIATTVASIGVFIVALWLLNVVRIAAGAVVIARDAIAIVRDEGLDDAARESATRRGSLQLIATFASILVRSALAVGASFLPIWLAHMTGVATSEQIINFLSRWDVIMTATVVIPVSYVAWMRLWPSI